MDECILTVIVFEVKLILPTCGQIHTSDLHVAAMCRHLHSSRCLTFDRSSPMLIGTLHVRLCPTLQSSHAATNSVLIMQRHVMCLYKPDLCNGMMYVEQSGIRTAQMQ